MGIITLMRLLLQYPQMKCQLGRVHAEWTNDERGERSDIDNYPKDLRTPESPLKIVRQETDIVQEPRDNMIISQQPIQNSECVYDKNECVLEYDDNEDYYIDSVEIEDVNDEAHFSCLAKSYCSDLAVYNVNSELGLEPRNYIEAIESPEHKAWENAIQDELDSLERNQTWKLVNKSEVPKSITILDSRWIFKHKCEGNEKIRYKGRLVTRGFKDKSEYDLTETYAPVTRISDVHFVLSVANKYDFELFQLDVKTAFLNGKLEKPVYMKIPEGYLCDENTKRNKVCLLQRALYGLKVSPKRWYLEFNTAMERLGFRAYKFRPCIFKWHKNDHYVLLLLYVDDILLTGNCADKIHETKRRLKQAFEITDLGEPKRFLGLEIVRNREDRVMYICTSEEIY